MRPATFDEIDRFCKIDGWQLVRATGHNRWEKTYRCPGFNEDFNLWTETSHAGNNSPSPGVWRVILREQLKISEDDFWDVLHSANPFNRCPPPPPRQAPRVPANLARQLERDLHFGAKQIEGMSKEKALELLREHWSKGQYH